MTAHAKVPGDTRTATRVTSSMLGPDSIRRLVARGTRVRLTVRGSAASPTVRSGDRVILGPWRDRALRGDLLVACSGEGMAIRRFVDRPSEGVMFATAGDASGRGVPLAETALVARVEAVERTGRVVRRDPRGHVFARIASATRQLVRRMAG